MNSTTIRELQFFFDHSVQAACSTLVFSDNLLSKWNESVLSFKEVMTMAKTWPAPNNFPFLLQAKFRKPLLPSMLYYPIIHSNSSTSSLCRNFKLLRWETMRKRNRRCVCTLHKTFKITIVVVPYYKGCELQYMSLKSN